MSEDICALNGNGDRRKHCELVISVNTKFDDFLARYERNQNELREWRITGEHNILSLTNAISNLTQTISDMRRPYIVIRWIFAGIGIGFLGGLGAFLWEFFKRRMG